MPLSVHSSLPLQVRAELSTPGTRKLDEHHRLTHQREVRQLISLQPALHQREREDVVNYARPKLRVRHERHEPEHGARERRHKRVRRRAHANRHARAMGESGGRAGGLGGVARLTCVVMNGRRTRAASSANVRTRMKARTTRRRLCTKRSV
jgi:hypothetical protein